MCASCLLMNALHGQWSSFCVTICRHCHNATRPQPDPRRVSARFRLDLPEHGLRPVPGGRRPALRSLVTRLPSPHNHHVRLDSLLFPLLHFVHLSFLDPLCYDSRYDSSLMAPAPSRMVRLHRRQAAAPVAPLLSPTTCVWSVQGRPTDRPSALSKLSTIHNAGRSKSQVRDG